MQKIVFKKHIFHNDNIEEEYYWDDYDTTIPPATPVCKHVTIKQRHIPKITNRPINLLSNAKIKILVSRKLSVSTQTDNPVCDDSSQTFPKFYFPRPKSNFNFEPFNTNMIL